MHLPEVERSYPEGERGEAIRQAVAAGAPVPQIMHLFAFRPEATRHLGQFTQAIMRGPGETTPAIRETIAALTSRANDCHF